MLNFDAVIFDLDGVITQTALVHGEAWKRMFDDFLKKREKELNEPFREFTHTEDYLPYVDGKPRYKGVASFLESRKIKLPFGDPSDLPGHDTVCALGNMKNIMFNEVLDKEGVKVYPGTVSIIHELKKQGLRIGVASSSKNCKQVLEKTGLLDLFETRIDGVVSAEIGLKGKPEADIFTTACDRLSVEYHRSVVVEDAVSGVQAGKNGNFGLVIGIAREDNTDELLVNGGDIVVNDLSELTVNDIDEWFKTGIEEDSWNLKYYDYDTTKERSREALLTIGNGYFGTRGALEESSANKVNYPGTYIAGLFNRLVSQVGERNIENEDYVNIPNWLPIKFRIGDEEWFEFGPDMNFEILRIKRKLNFKTGELVRELDVKDKKGRITNIRSSRFAGMHYQHLGVMKYIIKPLNYSEEITIRSELNGDHINAGVERYNQLNQRHLCHTFEKIDGNRCYLEVITTHSNVTIAMGAMHILNGNKDLGDIMDCACSKGKACQDFKIQAEEGREINFEKLVSIYTSQDRKVIIPLRHARTAIDKMSDYEGELKLSANAWSKIWSEIDIRIEGDRFSQKLLRLHMYHMMVTSSPHHKYLDAGIPPRGLHGEAYRGHIFWDELYILPFYNIHFPETVKSVLMYRYRRLDKARDYAREYGFKGAMFPWQSGSDGREETQVVHLNPVSGEWGEDYSSLQRHISLAIAYNIWNFYIVTHDRVFMVKYGAEMLFDICRFWVSKCEFDESAGGYHIDKVMGPDEFHEKLEGSESGGLRDNAYTNIMVSWLLGKAISLNEELTDDEKRRIYRKLKMPREELNEWVSMKQNILLSINDEGIIEQFSGYFDLEELDWEYYRKKYENIHRLDRILKSEGKSTDKYKLSKQADLLMSFYNLGEDEVTSILKELGCKLPKNYFRKNFDYYISRTSHGSTLSKLVHSNLAYSLGDYESGWQMYIDALRSDLEDTQGGTTGEGIHCGVMAGTVFAVLSVFCGLDLSGDIPVLCPDLPGHWKSVEFSFAYRRNNFFIKIYDGFIEIIATRLIKEKIKFHICGEYFEIKDGRKLRFKIK